MTRTRRVGTGLYARRGKRAFDLVAATSVGVVTLPVQAVVAALVRAKLGSPVLFRQERPGLNEKPFTLIKFRTMTDDRDADGELLPDERAPHPFRPVPAQHQPRRAPRAVERRQGGHEPGRAATPAHEVPPALLLRAELAGMRSAQA